MSVQQVLQDIERAQLKGEASEEELKALEIDMTGKIMLASWRGTRFEVVQVLREVRVSHHTLCFSAHSITHSTCAYRIQVVDHVLKEPNVSDKELYNRARGLLLLGAIFKCTIPDESDEERRELERCVTSFSPFFLVHWRVSYCQVI